VGQADGAGLNDACLFFGIATLFVFLYNGTVRMFFAPFTVRMERRLRVKLYDRIASLSYEKIESLPQGEWLTRLNIDVQAPFSQPVHVPGAVCAIVNICASGSILWLINPEVFGLVILFVAPHIIASRLVIARAMPGLNKKALESAAKNAGELTSFITCADTAALYGGQNYLMRRFELSGIDLFKAKMKIIKWNSLNAAIMPLFSLSGYLTLLIVSGGWIAGGRMTFGDLTAAFQYRGGVLLGSFALINSLISIYSSMAGIRRLNETIDEKAEE